MLSRLKIIVPQFKGRLILDKVYDVRPLDPEKYKNNTTDANDSKLL